MGVEEEEEEEEADNERSCLPLSLLDLRRLQPLPAPKRRWGPQRAADLRPFPPPHPLTSGARALRCYLSNPGSNPPAHEFKILGKSNETRSSSTDVKEKSESDRLVDGLDFGELCNEFECLSSPAVESTARQLARDILELREGNRALGSYSVSVKYKDPIRTFTGREKYKRPLWATGALENPSVTVQDMVMLSTSTLSIKWTLRGKPKNPIFALGGDLILRVNSQFILNQISGQVIEHEEFWDVSSSSALAQGYFWISRRLFSAIESGKDTVNAAKDITSGFSNEKEKMDVYPDPLGDPTKFFQRDDGFMRDAYQIALFLAIIYFVVQFLRQTV